MKKERYLHRHRFLHMIWQGFPEFFTTVSFSDQRRIHDYYRPHSDLTDEQLLAPRRIEAMYEKGTRVEVAQTDSPNLIFDGTGEVVHATDTHASVRMDGPSEREAVLLLRLERIRPLQPRP